MSVLEFQETGANVKVAPYFPHQQSAVFFAISADDCLLHFRREALTEKQLADDTANKDLIALLQVGSMFVAKPGDQVAVYEDFNREPWRTTLARYHAGFQQLGLSPVDFDDLHFHPREDFYRPLAESPPDADLVTVYLLSGSNEALHPSPDLLDLSRTVNSKMHLARNAAEQGIPVPDTLVCTKGTLADARPRRFLDAHGGEVMLKVMGLAGARNVTAISSIEAGLDYLSEYGDDMELVLQQKLAADRYTEMTVDLMVSDDQVRIANARRILFSDGLWVGNYISEAVTLTDIQAQTLIRVGEYVRSLGYSARQGLNCGIDFFVSSDDIQVIEINARWTGGLLPAEMARRLNLGRTDAVASFDTVSADRLNDYLAFAERYLFGTHDGAFAVAPMGFSPYFYEVEGERRVHVWQLTIGDYENFKRVKDEVLGPDQLPVASTIDLCHITDHTTGTRS